MDRTDPSVYWIDIGTKNSAEGIKGALCLFIKQLCN